jgi:integrase
VEAVAAWLSHVRGTSELQRDSSTDVYEHMWNGWATWAISKGIPLHEASAADLIAYLESRGGADELSNRYAWRLLRIVDKVTAHYCRSRDLRRNLAAQQVLEQNPEIRYANASKADPLPDYLPASEAKRLVAYLSSIRAGAEAAGRAWQDIRNRAAVGLMLGAGLGPGEVRSLRLTDVVTQAGRSRDVPWKLRIAASGDRAARETPLALWAGQLLKYWLQVRSEQGIPGSMTFPSTKGTGKTWGKVAQYEAVKQVLQAAGIEEVTGGSFRLRHTFALRQLKRGKSDQEVASWLGVSDPAVMERYRRVVMAPIDIS